MRMKMTTQPNTPPKRKLTPKRRRRSKGRQYFTKVHEEAIVKYASSDDFREREKLYRELIGPAFNELVDKIVFTYKFNTLPNIDDLKSECKVWLTTILEKFDPDKGSKAFSYFSVITKNWFIHKVKKNAKTLKREVYMEDMTSDTDFSHVSVFNPYHETREDKEFFDTLKNELDEWSRLDLKEGELKVLEAIRILMTSSEEIEIFNKKAIYLYIREITDFNTKQVANNLNKIRMKYRVFKSKWDNEE